MAVPIPGLADMFSPPFSLFHQAWARFPFERKRIGQNGIIIKINRMRLF
jgi:hypothetical protein